ncbi:Pre-mRNA-splicing factor Slu7 [Babesia sp. Xinjiang]|uniref:Pre-mRNA-splicing factor Slu7 n=1 Tax=Babesia sp. Xinjiang TaxID=462227 RepID=UPI000A25C547|nr:Pre-mRNA-splicing factor Slu7 [Babesia sp. Xinjiang]ORM41403.1 Pre-mRNA-splicing factor Slu7 [Babesia sp. Xinjiang]
MSGDTSQPGGDSRRDNCTAGPRTEQEGVEASDVSSGNANPYIPRFIAKAPWYLNATPGLQHQRAHEQNKTHLEPPKCRGVTSHVAIKYRKNACANCGAVTHDAKSCVERPRKKGAKYTNSNICPDEYIEQNSAVGYEAVRDRWAGFDASTHQLLVEEYKDVEEEQHRRKMQQLAADLKENKPEVGGPPTELQTGEFEDAETTFGTTDDRTRTTTRNLRIREDTAKYLINLDINSAYYDPKSRSLRGDPLLGMVNTEKHTFRGDNELFTSGDSSKPKEIEQFAWEAQCKGATVSFMAQPTELEFMFKEESEKHQNEKEAQRKALLERFGGSEYLGTPNDAIIEQPRETSPPTDGCTALDVLHLATHEEAYSLGHNSVWGSYYDVDNKRWGYKCCKGAVKEQHCTLNLR